MLKWFTADGAPTNLVKIIQIARSYVEQNGKIYVGTDSFISKSKVTFASTICLHGADNSRGGQYFLRPSEKWISADYQAIQNDPDAKAFILHLSESLSP